MRDAHRLRRDDAGRHLERRGRGEHADARVGRRASVVTRMVGADGGEEPECLRQRQRILRAGRRELDWQLDPPEHGHDDRGGRCRRDHRLRHVGQGGCLRQRDGGRCRRIRRLDRRRRNAAAGFRVIKRRDRRLRLAHRSKVPVPDPSLDTSINWLGDIAPAGITAAGHRQVPHPRRRGRRHRLHRCGSRRRARIGRRRRRRRRIGLRRRRGGRRRGGILRFRLLILRRRRRGGR